MKASMFEKSFFLFLPIFFLAFLPILSLCDTSVWLWCINFTNKCCFRRCYFTFTRLSTARKFLVRLIFRVCTRHPQAINILLHHSVSLLILLNIFFTFVRLRDCTLILIHFFVRFLWLSWLFLMHTQSAPNAHAL